MKRLMSLIMLAGTLGLVLSAFSFSPGTYASEMRVPNISGTTAYPGGSFTLTCYVANVGRPGSINATVLAGSNITLTGGNVPSGVALGRYETYRFTISGGLTNPTLAGTLTFTITWVDEDGQVRVNSFPVTVNPAGPATAPAGAAPKTPGKGPPPKSPGGGVKRIIPRGK